MPDGILADYMTVLEQGHGDQWRYFRLRNRFNWLRAILLIDGQIDGALKEEGNDKEKTSGQVGHHPSRLDPVPPHEPVDLSLSEVVQGHIDAICKLEKRLDAHADITDGQQKAFASPGPSLNDASAHLAAMRTCARFLRKKRFEFFQKFEVLLGLHRRL
jgi:hypothetical protein